MMMAMRRGARWAALLAAVALACAGAARAQGHIPCHKGKTTLAAPGCKAVTIPAGLCTQCKLRKVNDKNGNFINCKSIYNLDNGQCKAKLQQYVKANACDGKRKQQVAAWNAHSKMQLDYFVYSLCEQCCDCVPNGALPAQYAQRKNKRSLLHNARGNCPAHAFYDICKIWPNIETLSPGGGKKGNGVKACAQLSKWFHSPAASNWINNHNTPLSGALRNFLNNVNVANQCGNKQVWQACALMEQKQKRI